MKAVRIHHHGGVEQLRCEELAEPQIQRADDVIVQLKAAAVNFSDLQIRRGSDASRADLPRVLGSDGAGQVVAIGSAVNAVKIGDSVCLYPQQGCGTCAACGGDRPEFCDQARRLGAQVDGTYAEFVRVAAQNCVPLPAQFSFAEGAAVAVSHLSAWRMLITDAQLKPGEAVLIRGIGSDIATAAWQLATRTGAHVIVTADNPQTLAKAAQLGAAEGIDETAVDFAAEVRRRTAKRGVDVVVDCLGGAGWTKSFAALARDGRLVTCGASAGTHAASDLRRIFWHHLKVFGSSLGSRAELRQALNYLTCTGSKPVIDKVFPLAQAAAAQQRFETGQQFGKIVLAIGG